ncbi:transposase [Streptomyces chartreusis]|uniref:transposase n=1 Tax=Streptomyces chartreusis TaxID=1969 RepID=UPI0033AC05BD
MCLRPRLHVRARTPRRAQRSTTDQPELGGATTASCSTNRQSCSTPSHSTSRSRTPRHQPHATAQLGRRRWVIERTMSWLSGYRRLSPRYERNPRNYLGFLGVAAAMCCYKRLVRLTT